MALILYGNPVVAEWAINTAADCIPKALHATGLLTASARDDGKYIKHLEEIIILKEVFF